MIDRTHKGEYLGLDKNSRSFFDAVFLNAKDLEETMKISNDLDAQKTIALEKTITRIMEMNKTK